MTKEEAKKEAERKNNDFDRKRVFCPLTKYMCRTDCYCWEKSYTFAVNLKKDWSVRGSQCTCYLLVGGG